MAPRAGESQRGWIRAETHAAAGRGSDYAPGPAVGLVLLSTGQAVGNPSNTHQKEKIQ